MTGDPNCLYTIDAVSSYQAECPQPLRVCDGWERTLRRDFWLARRRMPGCEPPRTLLERLSGRLLELVVFEMLRKKQQCPMLGDSETLHVVHRRGADLVTLFSGSSLVEILIALDCASKAGTRPPNVE